MSAQDNLGPQFRMHVENYGGGEWKEGFPADEHHPYEHPHYIERPVEEQSHMVWASTGNNKALGHMTWDKGVVNAVEVYNTDRWGRKGMATQMWNRAREITPNLRHSSNRSDMGNAWAKKVGGELPERVQDHPEWYK